MKVTYVEGDLVVVKWLDHFSQEAPMEREELRKKDGFESVGWFLRENKRYIYLVRDKQIDGRVACVLAVAKALILDVELVKAAA